ncbi:hypothetical protein [Rhodococcus yananensis]|uniref:hypothetical protein n=1 Tax=Rhodococcus yananensis TaxID=2879464 RepID=UPI001CF89A29|nr:hypothetical protein [Rhodococcus yananensis]
MTSPEHTPASDTELVLVVEISQTGLGTAADLATLADVLRETAHDLIPGVSTHTTVNPGIPSRRIA